MHGLVFFTNNKKCRVSSAHSGVSEKKDRERETRGTREKESIWGNQVLVVYFFFRQRTFLSLAR